MIRRSIFSSKLKNWSSSSTIRKLTGGIAHRIHMHNVPREINMNTERSMFSVSSFCTHFRKNLSQRRCSSVSSGRKLICNNLRRNISSATFNTFNRIKFNFPNASHFSTDNKNTNNENKNVNIPDGDKEYLRRTSVVMGFMDEDNSTLKDETDATEKKIRDALEQELRPKLASEGKTVSFRGWNKQWGVVQVEMPKEVYEPEVLKFLQEKVPEAELKVVLRVEIDRLEW